MRNKIELILDELIKNYIKRKEPISSSLLKELANLNISPSTIRGYFQNLEKEGLIEKEHVSSGSFPSVKAMEFFWKKEIPKEINEFENIELLKKKCEEYDVFMFIKIFENQLLKEIYNLNNKFIILEFENDEAVIRYDPLIFNFLKSLTNMYVKDLDILFKKYQLNLLLKKIKNFQKLITINENLLYNKFNQIDLNKLSQIDDLKVDYENKILIKKFINKNFEKEVEVFIIGDVYTDFISFFESMKGGENEQKT